MQAPRAVAIAQASRSPRCFGGRVARRRLAAHQSDVEEIFRVVDAAIILPGRATLLVSYLLNVKS
jgi:hypothetical protein